MAAARREKVTPPLRDDVYPFRQLRTTEPHRLPGLCTLPPTAPRRPGHPPMYLARTPATTCRYRWCVAPAIPNVAHMWTIRPSCCRGTRSRHITDRRRPSTQGDQPEHAAQGSSTSGSPGPPRSSPAASAASAASGVTGLIHLCADHVAPAAIATSSPNTSRSISRNDRPSLSAIHFPKAGVAVTTAANYPGDPRRRAPPYPTGLKERRPLAPHRHAPLRESKGGRGMVARGLRFGALGELSDSLGLKPSPVSDIGSGPGAGEGRTDRGADGLVGPLPAGSPGGGRLARPAGRCPARHGAGGAAVLIEDRTPVREWATFARGAAPGRGPILGRAGVSAVDRGGCGWRCGRKYQERVRQGLLRGRRT